MDLRKEDIAKETEEKLARSLTAETTELIPFLPYLLQDFWELGSDPDVIVKLILKHAALPKDAQILDLACGKGAVSVKLAKKLGVKVKGIDLTPEFIDYAAGKAKEYGVGDLCEFVQGDICDAVNNEKGYDCTVFGAAGNVLGDPAQTLEALKATVKTGGYILIDECYLPDSAGREDVKYKNYEYLTEAQWAALFKEKGLELIEADENGDSGADTGMADITARVNELIKEYPDKRDIFEGYIRSQQNEYDDIDSSLICVTWILRKL